MKNTLIIISLVFVWISLSSKILMVPESSPTINEAINVATKGDTIILKPGIYKETLLIKEKNLTIASKFILAHDKKYTMSTVINGEGKNSVVSFLDCPDRSYIVGVSIINGYGKKGGGILIENSDVDLLNLNVIQNSSTNKGGGIYIYNSNVNMVDDVIKGNSAIGVGAGGGGIYATGSSIDLYNVDVLENLSFLGGGIYSSNNDISLKNVNIKKNSADSKAGGFYLINSKTPTLKNVNIIENSAFKVGGVSGGLCLENTDPIIVNMRVSKNIAFKGGGVYLAYSNPQFVNSLIDGNKAKDYAGAVYCYHSNPEFVNTTIADNSSKKTGGILCERMSKPIITNSILWNNGDESFSKDFMSNLTISYSIISGQLLGKNVYHKAPSFLDAKNGDYHLTSVSFGLDIGNPQKKYNDRNGSRNDMGCYGGKLNNW